MADRKLKSRLPIIISAILLTVFGCLSVHGMGYIPHGGLVTVGMSLASLTDTSAGPVTPLNSILLDEHLPSIMPLGNTTGFSTWEMREQDILRLSVTPGMVVSEEFGVNLSADRIAGRLVSRTRERWDALWALRHVNGIGTDDIHHSLAAVNNTTLDITLKNGVDQDDVLRALTSPALRLDLTDSYGETDGAGPFIRWQPSTEHHRFTSMLSHHAGRPYIDEFTVIAYPSAEESVLDFGRGSLDALLLASSEIDRYTGSSRAEPERIIKIGDALIVLMFNPVRLPDADERRALSIAVDRESLAQVILGEGASAAIDFMGNPPQSADAFGTPDDAADLHSSIIEPKDRLTVLVPDDPAAKAAAGRLRANIQSLGVPVDLVYDSGPLKLSMDADIIMVSIRLIEGSEGILPQCLALYDSNGWWNLAGLALPHDDWQVLNSVRALEPVSDLTLLGQGLQNASLIVPLAKYGIFFAPGPDVELVSENVYPGTLFWRTYVSRTGSGPDVNGL